MSFISITIDSRAPLALKRADYSAPLTIAPLPVGTVWGVCDDGQLLAIWCIGVADLLHQIRTKELGARAAQLQQISAWSYLIIVGDMRASSDGHLLHDGRTTGWRWSAVQGALLSVQEAGSGVVVAPSETTAIAQILLLAARERGPRRVRPPRELLFSSPAEDLLMALPGIGEERADALLKHCGSAAWALAALSEPGTELPGIGPAIRHDARASLGLQDGQIITIHMQQEHQHDTSEHTRNGTGTAPGTDPGALAIDRPDRASSAPVAALRGE